MGPVHAPYSGKNPTVRGYHAEEIVAILEGGYFLSPDFSKGIVHYLATDTRRLTYPAESLYIALEGPRRDGHDFLLHAFQQGVRVLLVSKDIELERFPGCAVIKVPDTLKALQQLTSFHRRRFSLPVIGITGSNGKTIVKEWLFQLLSADHRIVRSPRSYNSQIGVPLSVWNIQQTHTLGIFEAGISMPGEMQRLSDILKCDIGIFTNLGAAHDEGFSNRSEKLREKCRLFAHSKTVVYCRDQAGVEQELQKQTNGRLFSWSMKEGADLQVQAIESVDNSTGITVIWQGLPLAFSIPFTGHAAIENALHCVSVMLLIGYQREVIQERMSRLEPVAMRLELKSGLYGSRLINDSYNSDLNGLEIALDFLQQHSPGQQRILILSDLLQTGLPKDTLYQQVAQLVVHQGIHHFIGIGPDIEVVGQWLVDDVNFSHYLDTDSFLSHVNPAQFRDSVVLIKGARLFRFEEIVDQLSLQAHRTVLEVDLDIISANVQVFSRHLNPQTAIMAVIKASAYGSGSAEVARLMQFHQVDALAVAYADEGVELRRAGVTLPILVLNADEGSFPLLRKWQLEPEVYSLEQLKSLTRYLAGATPPLQVQLKFDTGMHRLGFEERDLPELSNLLTDAGIEVSAVSSHFASAGNPGDDEFSHEQARRFQRMHAIVSKILGYSPPRHLLNSSGILRFPEYQFEMVRLGIGLYGIALGAQGTEGLKPALTLRSFIQQIRTVQAGETVGYNRAGKINHPTRVGTVSVGYADGLPRLAGNGRYALLVNGQEAPIIGDICMDMCMIDLSDIPEASSEDEVVVFGAGHPIERLAQAGMTIPYEILTDISPRVKRVYLKE